MDLVVGNSIVKYWGNETGQNVRVFCLPGATLDMILLKAIAEQREDDRYVYLQSGIPDLHRKGENFGILPERLNLYKQTLRKTHQYVPKAVILMIYPPLNANQEICNQYHDINKLIVDLNTIKTPNTISRIFHRDHKNRWRVECARLVDGIHPTREEISRMVRRLFDGIDSQETSSPETVGNSRKRIRSSTTKSVEDNGTTTEPKERIMVTIEGPSSSSTKIEQLLLQKKQKLANLKEEFDRREKEIEEECVEKIRRVLEVPKPCSRRETIQESSEDFTEPFQDHHDEEFMVLDEWTSDNRDIPRRVYLS